MTEAEALKAIRAICENAPKHQDARTMPQWAVHVEMMEGCIGAIYRLCIEAETDIDSLTGCADDQQFADVTPEALRDALDMVRPK